MAARPKAVAIQHVAPEPPNAIGTALEAAGLAMEIVRTDRGEPVPRSAAGLAALVVMGGPMSVYEADGYPHLSHEMQLIESALARGVPVLAVCLGSQLLAHVLGARVAPAGFLEVGWFPVTLDPAAADDPILGGCPSGFTALHWHGDAFELPRAAVGLARSERTPLQAFRYSSAHGLLFHAEVDEVQVEAMARAFPADLERAGTSAAELLDGVRRHGATLQNLATEIYGRFARLARGT